MNKKHWIIINAVVLALGFTCGYYLGKNRSPERSREQAPVLVSSNKESRATRVDTAPRAVREVEPLKTEAVEKAAPPVSQPKWELLGDLKRRKLVNSVMTAISGDNKITPAFIELFGLNADEVLNLQTSLDETRARLGKLAVQNATVATNAAGAVVIKVSSFTEEGRQVYNDWTKEWAGILGAERHATFAAIAGEEVERALSAFGAGERTVTISTAVKDGVEQTVVTENYIFGQRRGTKAGAFPSRDEAARNLGALGELIPPHVGR